MTRTRQRKNLDPNLRAVNKDKGGTMGEIIYKGLFGALSENCYNNLSENGYVKAVLIKEFMGDNNEY